MVDFATHFVPPRAPTQPYRMSSTTAALLDFAAELWTPEFLLRCAISCVIATTLYFAFGALCAKLWPREVKRDTAKEDVFLALVSLVFGSPVLQIFGVAAEKHGVSKMYFDFAQAPGGVWGYALSIPLYFLLWDAVFYVTHLILHWGVSVPRAPGAVRARASAPQPVIRPLISAHQLTDDVQGLTHRCKL